MKVLLLADGKVGGEITAWLINKYPGDLIGVITAGNTAVYKLSQKAKIPSFIYYDDESAIAMAKKCDVMILAWWPWIISKELKSAAPTVMNTHPAYLPFHRGKHSSFWALKNMEPFGVSIHTLGEGIDDGPVIARQRIMYDWEDNGETLYKKSQDEMINIFKSVYPSIKSGNYTPVPQKLEEGSFHLAKEIDEASRIDLNELCSCKDLLTKLRARTFTGYPSCWFEENGQIYEVRVQIKRRKYVPPQDNKA